MSEAKTINHTGFLCNSEKAIVEGTDPDTECVYHIPVSVADLEKAVVAVKQLEDFRKETGHLAHIIIDANQDKEEEETKKG